MVRRLADNFGGQFLKAANYPEPRKLKITKITDEEVGRDKEQKIAVWFENEDRALILNKVNAESICEIAKTDDLDECIGLTIVLYSTQVDFAGRTVDAIRVRAPKDKSNDSFLTGKHQQAMDATATEEDDEIPF